MPFPLVKEDVSYPQSGPGPNGRTPIMPEFTGIEPFTTWDGAFSAAELDSIVAYGDALSMAEAGVLESAAGDGSFRNTRIS